MFSPSEIFTYGELYDAFVGTYASELFAMRAKSLVEDRRPAPLSDEDRVLAVLRDIQGSVGRGATRFEIAKHIENSKINLSASLGILLEQRLVVCEGVSGDILSACWRTFDEA